MKNRYYILLTFLIGAMIFSSCEDDNVNVSAGIDYPEAATGVTLKSAGNALGLKIGVGFGYEDMATNAGAIIPQEFDNVTFGYHMKHGAIVQGDGSYNWGRTDEMVKWVQDKGLDIYGHTLVWHQNQNAVYLNNLSGGTGGGSYANLLPSGDMETGTLDGWQVANAGLGIGITSEDMHKGNHAVKLQSDPQYNTAWRLQLKAPIVKVVPGHLYKIEFWARCAEGGGKVRISTGAANQLNGANTGDDRQYLPDFDVTEEWTKFTYEAVYGEGLVAVGNELQIVFDMGHVGGKTYYLDDVVINDLSPRISNGDFESGALDGWQVANAGLGIAITTEDAHKGEFAVKLMADPQYNTEWRLQLKAPAAPAIVGNQYKIEFWARCVGGGGKLRVSTGGGDQLVGANTGDSRQYMPNFDVPDEWTKFTYESVYGEGLKAGSDEVQIVFDMGHIGGKTYYLDDVAFYDVTAGEGAGAGGDDNNEEVKTTVQMAMTSWIDALVGRYKSQVKAWDVVNEPMADGNSGVRTSANSDSEGSDVFYWSDVLGRDYAVYAFEAAHAADPEALLFINDYNLESNPAKLDSLIQYVAEVQAKLDARGSGAKIHGIGTQMHIADVKNYPQILPMFEKLAQTGLKIKITELDVKVNSLKSASYTLTDVDAEFQGAMYKYIIDTYLKVVPKEQQYGITFWGVSDANSWLNEVEKNIYYHPLLWDDEFQRKPAYDAVVLSFEENRK